MTAPEFQRHPGNYALIAPILYTESR